MLQPSISGQIGVENYSEPQFNGGKGAKGSVF